MRRRPEVPCVARWVRSRRLRPPREVVVCLPLPLPEPALPSAPLPDADVPDASLSDAVLADAPLSDASLPDAVVADAAVPDARVPDASAPVPERISPTDCIFADQDSTWSYPPRPTAFQSFPGSSPTATLMHGGNLRVRWQAGGHRGRRRPGARGPLLSVARKVMTVGVAPKPVTPADATVYAGLADTQRLWPPDAGR